VRSAALLATLLATSGTALAHGRPPYIESIAFDGSNPDRIIAQISYGLLITEDGGDAWRFVCAAAFEADPDREDPPFAISSDGSIAVGTFGGLWHGRPDACVWSSSVGDFGVDVAADPHVENALWALTSRLPDPDLLQRSVDGGRTWAPFGAPIEGRFASSIATAPSDPSRLYIAAYLPATETEPRRSFVLRSDDGGASFETIEITLGTDEQLAIIANVDPTNADRLFVRVRKREGIATPERLLYSVDGGRTYEQVLAITRLRATAMSDDGQTVWAGSDTIGGLWVARNGSLDFEQVNTLPVRCLEARGDELWICANPYASDYAIGRSSDAGVTIDPALYLEDVTELLPCDRCSPAGFTCIELLDDLVYDVDRYLGSMTLPPPGASDAGLLERCAGDASVPAPDAGPRLDAGTPEDASADAGDVETPPSGCGCRGAPPGGGAWWLFLLVLALLARGRRSALSVLLVAALFAPSAALAHGRPTAVHHLAFDPADPDRLVLQTTFGLVESVDAGASWRWICAASYGADPTVEDPDVVVSSGGALVLATFGGVAVSDLCEVTFAEGPVRASYVVDLAADPTSASIVWGVVSSGVVPDVVVRSDDAGGTFAQIGTPIDDILLERIAVAPSRPTRIYASGAVPMTATEPRRAFFLRSDDAGETFARIEIPLSADERFPHVLAVDPTNPERVFVKIERAPLDADPERLLVSEDGGATFEPLFELPMLRGFAVSPDGRTLWAGSALGGLWAARDGASAFEQIGEQHVLCLEARGAELWMCLDQSFDGFALGRSSDGGASFEDRLHLDEVTELPTCARCSETAITCPAWQADLETDYEIYFGSGDGGMTGLPRDAAVPVECGGPPPPGDCGCRATRASSGAALWLVLLGLLLARAPLRTGWRSAGRSRTSGP
jgi:MYXO-CTERM domain-containing protein